MNNDTPFLMVDKEGNYKGFDFSPWGGIEGFLEMSKHSGANGSAYKARVPELLHAINKTATAVASLPFDICDEEENVVDSSLDWENVVGGMPNPQRLIYQIASSLCGGSAYVLPTATSRAVFDLQYLAPQTITPWIDRGGLQHFDRVTDQGVSERIAPKDIMYFWLPDSDVELGPALSHPLGAASHYAALLMNMSTSLDFMARRGFIPPTIMLVDGMVLPGEKERAEKWWNTWLRNPMGQIVKILNAQKAELHAAGAGMEQLKGTYVELKRDAVEGISMAFGIPPGIFMSDKSFASEVMPLVKEWYSSSVFTTIYHTIEETFTDQLLKPFGYSMYFRPESIDAFQEDENERGKAVDTLTTAIDKNPKVAFFVMDYVLGYELSEEAETAKAEIIADKEEQQEREAEMAQTELAYNDPANQPQPIAQAKPKPTATRAISLTPPMITDLKTWCDMAKRFYSKGKPIPFDFECKALPDELASPIRERLRNANNELDIIKAFEISDMITELADSDELKALTDAINKATETPLPQAAPVYNFTMPDITLTANMPEQGTVTVNVPQQAAPVVNVTNTVPQSAAPVVNVAAPVVTNEVTVKPADVILPKPSSATVQRDAKGKISGIKTD